MTFDGRSSFCHKFLLGGLCICLFVSILLFYDWYCYYQYYYHCFCSKINHNHNHNKPESKSTVLLPLTEAKQNSVKILSSPMDAQKLEEKGEKGRRELNIENNTYLPPFPLPFSPTFINFYSFFLVFVQHFGQ